MYERFSDRARKILHLANQEAQRFNHEYIGTEHLLVGLIKEGTGIAANVLINLGISLPKVHERIEAIIQHGPEVVKMGKLPQSPRAKRAIEYAIESARGMNVNYVGSEHLLLGLLRENEGLAGQVLAQFGIKLNEVEQEILQMLGQAATNLEQLKRTEEDYAEIMEHIKTICGNALPAQEAFERIARVIKIFNETGPPDADSPLMIDV